MTNKILLAAIALGLWANAAVNYVRPARAEDFTPSTAVSIENSVSSMDSSLKALLSSYQNRDDCRAH
ncbi:hypothetical protein D3273_26660 [Lichenibacterium minor]|uniref:Uncharacterized protein n=1 Tax=Lichenibacterium minor TaxID=2316528 RepID=A0A4Q2U2L8_9HYPH|nr:hypothetical protein [Lichenibacterium minor]RYC28926.1 hypothetical protein D3273_26660 [Lichenibacterium minor]